MDNRLNKRDKDIVEMLNALPYSSIILDEARKIVFSNRAFLNQTEEKTFEDLIGLKPGQAIKCKHLDAKTGECGISQNCRFCGILQAVLKAQVSKVRSTEEARVIISHGLHTIDYDLSITASPVNMGDNAFILLTIIDISGEKRKRALERIFFHDVLNKTGSLRGVAQLLNKNPNPEDQKELFSFINMLSYELNEELLVQKQLMAAENNELTINITAVNSSTIIKQSVEQIRQHSVAENKNVSIDPEPFEIEFNTDALLLKRILINMLKNALEASREGQTIAVTCKKAEKNKIDFRVHNHKYITEDVQLQVFHRSYSTKSNSRGLGTYSMKLLGERYLGGNVDFTSSKEKGTTFYITLPI